MQRHTDRKEVCESEERRVSTKVKSPVAGDLVMVSYSPNEHTNNPATKLDGQRFTVKRKRRIGVRGNEKWIYELDGAVSDMGIPYVFLEDELLPL